MSGEMSIALETAKNGMWTARMEREGTLPIYLHSRYDPAMESERFASAHLGDIEKEKPERIVVYGIGCGHHIQALLNQTMDSGLRIEAWESNVSFFKLIDHNGVLNGIKNNPRLQIVVTENLGSFSERMNEWAGNIHFIVHEPSLRLVPPELESFKESLRDYQVQKNSTIVHRELMQNNFDLNTREACPSVSVFRELPSMPAILISAGPSLTKSLALLPEASRHAWLGAVGTAVPLLLRQGIRPDFVVMTDPKPNMLDQLIGWENEDIPLFFLSTLYSGICEKYQGPKFILFQEGFAPAEDAASARGETLVPTGGSVSTTLFSLTRILGCEPICLVGQDLAYTDNMSHAIGTPLHQRWEEDSDENRVKAFDGWSTVRSSRNLLLYKKWFERQARERDKPYFNATEGGAYIEGFLHVALADFIAEVRGNDITEARRLLRNLTEPYLHL